MQLTCEWQPLLCAVLLRPPAMAGAELGHRRVQGTGVALPARSHAPPCPAGRAPPHRFSFSVLLWEIITGERPERGSLRHPRVPEECPQVRLHPAFLAVAWLRPCLLPLPSCTCASCCWHCSAAGGAAHTLPAWRVLSVCLEGRGASRHVQHSSFLSHNCTPALPRPHHLADPPYNAGGCGSHAPVWQPGAI